MMAQYFSAPRYSFTGTQKITFLAPIQWRPPPPKDISFGIKIYFQGPQKYILGEKF